MGENLPLTSPSLHHNSPVLPICEITSPEIFFQWRDTVIPTIFKAPGYLPQIVHKGPPIKRVAGGGEFSMMVDVRGNLFSFGCPEYGQLGKGLDFHVFYSFYNHREIFRTCPAESSDLA